MFDGNNQNAHRQNQNIKCKEFSLEDTLEKDNKNKVNM